MKIKLVSFPLTGIEPGTDEQPLFFFMQTYVRTQHKQLKSQPLQFCFVFFFFSINKAAWWLMESSRSKQNNIQQWTQFQYSCFHCNRHRRLGEALRTQSRSSRNGTIINSFPGHLLKMPFPSPSRWEGPLPGKSHISFSPDKRRNEK